MARMTTDQTIEVSVQPLTASGNPANIDGDAQFSFTSSTTGQNTGSFERTSATSAIFTPDSVGGVNVSVTVDADLDADEVRSITGTGMLDVITPEQEATTFEVTFGEPQG